MLGFQEETGHMYNLEATPAEGTTYRFAREDKKRYPGILQAGTPEAPYYINSSQLPVGFTDDLFEALARQEQLTPHDGGPAVEDAVLVAAGRGDGDARPGGEIQIGRAHV